MWVTYKCGVYDMSKFVQYHPGGPKILLAAGGSLEPFWELYAVHKDENVLEMLENMRIGNIDPEDMKKQKARITDASDPFANDPKRHPALRINSLKPFNAEPPPELLIDNFMTPNELFFVRNHLPVPTVDIKNYKLEISGEGLKKPVSFTLKDLKKKFEVHTITAVIQCAGNRRQEMSGVKQVKGLTWGTSAIGNATWTGVKLSDVLAYAGVKEDYIAHIQFEGLDKDVTGTSYGASIPVETAMDPKREVLLAFEMNGTDLPVDHGYPLRVVIPGTAGARHVKWLSKIIASKEESKSHWQRNDYKTFNPSVDWDTVDFSKAPAVQELPVQSAICDPLPNATVSDSGDVTVRGYAWSGGGNGISRVDVSVDGGKTWKSADLHQEPQKYHRQWSWAQWEAHIEIPKDSKGKLEIICKAVDSSNNTQPSDVEGIWNVRGLSNNSWHRVHVILSPDH